MTVANDILEVLHGTDSDRDFEISTRNAIETYPVPYLRPKTANRQIGVDVMPNGTVAAARKAWIDVCDKDIAAASPTDPVTVRAARVGIRDNYFELGGVWFGEATETPVAFVHGETIPGYFNSTKFYIGNVTEVGGVLVADYGMALTTGGQIFAATNNAICGVWNRKGGDGDMHRFQRDGSTKGGISMSGETVAYNSFCGAHWTQIDGNPKLLVGTVLDTTDELCTWEEGAIYPLAKCKVSDKTGSKSVYGVFFGLDEEGDYQVASIGAFKIRVKSGVMVKRGDLLKSAGDGTAKPQLLPFMMRGTLAKVASPKIIDQYDDGSYTVACTLHCG